MKHKKKAYLVKSQEAYDKLMNELEAKGYLWVDGDKPTETDIYSCRSSKYIDGMCIYLEDNKIFYGSVKFFRDHTFKYYDLIEYPEPSDHPGKELEGKQKRWKMTNKKRAYLVKSQEAYDDLMEKLEEEGHLWVSGRKPTELDYSTLRHYDDGICIYLRDSKKRISNSTFHQFKKQHSNDYDLVEYPGYGELRVVGEADPVNHPSHYQIGGIETLDLIEEMLSQEEFIGYLKGNIIKYRERHPYKGKSDQDLDKAKFYWDMLQELEWRRDN